MDAELANHFASDQVSEAKLCGTYGYVSQRSLRVEIVDITSMSIKFKQEGRNAAAYLPSMLFQQTPATDQLVRAEPAITLIHRANSALELADLFGPSSLESETRVQTQSNVGNNQ